MATLNSAMVSKDLLPYITNQNLKFLKQSIELSTKSFTIKDCFWQIFRMIHIQFIISFKTILFKLIYFPLIITTISILSDYEMVQADTCRPVNGSYLTPDCLKALKTESQAHEYILYQWYFIAIITISFVCFNTISIIEILNVFQNEHRNSK